MTAGKILRLRIDLSLELALDEAEASVRKPLKWGFSGAQTSSRSKSKPENINLKKNIRTGCLVEQMIWENAIWFFKKLVFLISEFL